MGYALVTVILLQVAMNYAPGPCPATVQITDKQFHSVSRDSVITLSPFVRVIKVASSGSFRFQGISDLKMDNLVNEVERKDYFKNEARRENRGLLDTALNDFFNFKYTGYRLKLKTVPKTDKGFLLVRYWRCIQYDFGKKREHHYAYHGGHWVTVDDVTTQIELHVFLLDSKSGMIVRYKRFAKEWSAISDPPLKTAIRLYERSERYVNNFVSDLVIR